MQSPLQHINVPGLKSNADGLLVPLVGQAAVKHSHHYGLQPGVDPFPLLQQTLELLHPQLGVLVNAHS